MGSLYLVPLLVCLLGQQVQAASISSWGDDQYGQVSNTPNGTDFIAVAGGYEHGYALAADGSISAWGYDQYGQVSGTPTEPGFTAIAAGFYHGYALAPNGSITAWGYDTYGGVSNTPTGLGFTTIAAGYNHGYALAADGSITAWGLDDVGQVSGTPTGSGFTAVAAANHHSYALAADGSITAWGDDDYTQVSGTPVEAGFTAIAAGYYHGYALAADGSITAWGYDNFGQVSGTPTGTGFIAIAAGNYHGYALAADGSITAWGRDYRGQVSGTPTEAGFSAIAAGSDHTYALSPVPEPSTLALLLIGGAGLCAYGVRRKRRLVSYSVVFLACAVCFSAGSAHASSLISGDSEFGPDTVTIDTATGLEWLDWTLYTNYSYNDVTTLMVPGGELDEWRYASDVELHALFDHAGVSVGAPDPASFDAAVALMGLIGMTQDQADVDYSHAQTSNTDGNGDHFYSSLEVVWYNQTGKGYLNYYPLPPENAYSLTGHALVRSAVPEPSSLALLLIGGVGLCGYGMRRKWRVVAFPVTAVFCLLFSGFTGTANASAVYDATAEFSTANGNPNGVWTYGGMDSSFTTFTPFAHATADLPNSPMWTHSSGSWNNPHIWLNGTGSTQYRVEDGQMSLHAGPGGESAVLRWTAPESGYWNIQGEFFPGNLASPQVGIRSGSTWLWEAIDAGSFDLTLMVDAGDAVDFHVYGVWSCGNTPLDATISSAVPEPSTLALLLIGGVGLCAYGVGRNRGRMLCLSLFPQCLMLLAPSVAQASSLIERDYLSPGDALITYDPNTGLEWLDWTETTGLAYNDMVLLLAPGHTYDGWRHATPQEAATLFSNAGLTEINSGNPNPLDVLLELIQLLGDTGTSNASPSSLGITGETHWSTGSHISAGLYGSEQFAYYGEAQTTAGYIPPDSPSIIHGHALVRSTVPEPSTLALLLIGSAGLCAYSIRKRSYFSSTLTSNDARTQPCGEAQYNRRRHCRH